MASLIVQLEDQPLDVDSTKKLQDSKNKKDEGEEESSEEEEDIPVEPFRFFDLPSEIRLRIYAFALFTPRRSRAPQNNGSVGASAKNPLVSPLSHRVNIFCVSRRMHDEASDYFYSSQTFRIFPIQDYCRSPTIDAILSRYRPSVATIELILGSSWTAPPRSWKVRKNLGLEDLVRVRTLKVFIQCDPSHPVFEGFRISKDFYSDFAGELLQQILQKLPSLKHVEFDGYPSVSKTGSLMARLLRETKAANKQVAWGPERGWTDYDKEDMIADALRGLNISRRNVPEVPAQKSEEVR